MKITLSQRKSYREPTVEWMNLRIKSKIWKKKKKNGNDFIAINNYI